VRPRMGTIRNQCVRGCSAGSRICSRRLAEQLIKPQRDPFANKECRIDGLSDGRGNVQVRLVQRTQMASSSQKVPAANSAAVRSE